MSAKDIDDFIKAAGPQKPIVSARYAEVRGRRTKEIELWSKWNDGGRKPEHLTPLIKSLEPLINKETKTRMQGLGGSIPQHAIRTELRTATVKALHSYDPTKSQLTTHVVNNFRRATDFIDANRNTKYMSKEDVARYGSFMNAYNEHMEEIGREPTAAELHQKLPQWSLKTIRNMRKGFGAEVFTDMGTDIDSGEDRVTPRDAAVLMRPKLTPQEWQFADLHFPREGDKQMSVKAIAKTMGLKEHRVYRIKTMVEKKIGPVLKKE